MSKAVKDMAVKYYPALWDDSRIEALVKAGALTQEEANEVTSVNKKEG